MGCRDTEELRVAENKEDLNDGLLGRIHELKVKYNNVQVCREGQC